MGGDNKWSGVEWSGERGGEEGAIGDRTRHQEGERQQQVERTFGFCSCFHVFMAQIIAVINNTDTGHGDTHRT